MKKNTGKNWYSGDKVQDLVDNIDANKEKIQGVTQKDSNYSEEMYSDDQLERHKDMDNIFTVDNVPSRWEHNKLRSTWHFDPMVDPDSETTFVVPVHLQGDFQPAIDFALREAKEMTMGNYRSRNASKQDADLHDGELMDMKRATGLDDYSSMYYDKVVRTKFDADGNKQRKENKVPEYEIFHEAIKQMDIDVHQSRIHVQKMGQCTPIHIDQQMRYARPGWRKIWTDAGADKQPLKLRRFLIMLQPWTQGHVWQFGNKYFQGYSGGEAVTYDWCNMPHGTANFAYEPRFTFQITGFVGEKMQGWIDDAYNGADPKIIKL